MGTFCPATPSTKDPFPVTFSASIFCSISARGISLRTQTVIALGACAAPHVYWMLRILRTYHVLTTGNPIFLDNLDPPLYRRGYRICVVNAVGKRCGACALKAQCTSGAFRFLAIHMDEPARQRARELANTPEFAKAQRQKKKVEALFAELKNQIGLRRLRLRRLKFVREQFFLAAAAQNIKRLMRFLSQPTTPTVEATT